MIFREIPVDSTPSRRFNTTFAKQQIIVSTYYNLTDGGWFVDFYDIDNDPLVLGVAIIPGFDILFQFTDLGIGEIAYLVSNSNDGQGVDDLGNTGKLISHAE